MADDNLTLALIIIAVILSIISLILAVNTSKKSEKQLRAVVQHLSLMHRSETAQELCKKIHAINPALCAGIDFTFREQDGGVDIDEWKTNHPRP